MANTAFNNNNQAWQWQTAGAVYVAWRVYWANRLAPTDCDEVYNYWEPLFFIMYNATEGGGQQTWEYAHEYALRTYAYLTPLKVVAQNIDLGRLVQETQPLLGWTDFPIQSDRLATFVGLKALLAASMAVAEVVWCHALTTTVWNAATTEHPRTHVGWYTLAVLGTAAGMNHSAAALLPSSTWMGAFLIASTAYLHAWHYMFCLVAVTATLTIGWPFGVLLLVPLGIRILWKEATRSTTSTTTGSRGGEGGAGGIMNVVKLLGFTALIAALVQSAVMYIDYQYYGVWVSPTLNIFTYNAASGGDELYGVEPASFYVKNLLLNLNVVAPLGVVVLPMLYFTQLRDMDVVVLLSPLYLWLAVTVPRPHKEERFLFPIYPLVVLGAVLTVDKMANFAGRLLSIVSRHKELMRRQRHALHIGAWSVAIVLSVSRAMALYKYYSAPLHIYAHLANVSPLSNSNNPTFVCTCGEWYRFPSSFFLPPGVHLRFLESSFKGQLPQPFSEFGSRPESQQVLQPFNDQNREEPSRYVNVTTCDWIIDLENGKCAPPDAHVAMSVPFLDASRTQALHRILYLPFLQREGQVHYQNYMLYKIS